MLAVVSAVPSVLMMVPPKMVPLTLFRPPVLKIPALPMSSVPVVLSNVPVRLTVLPAARVKLAPPR